MNLENIKDFKIIIKRIDVINYSYLQKDLSNQGKPATGINIISKFDEEKIKFFILEIDYNHEDITIPFEAKISFICKINFIEPLESPPTQQEVVNLLNNKLNSEFNKKIGEFNEFLDTSLPNITQIINKSEKKDGND